MINAATNQAFSAVFHGFATSKTIGATILDLQGNTVVDRTTAGISEEDLTVNALTDAVYIASSLGPVSRVGTYVLAADDGSNVKSETLVVGPPAYIDKQAIEALTADRDGGVYLVQGAALSTQDVSSESAARAAADGVLQSEIDAIGPIVMPGSPYLPLVGAADLSDWVQSGLLYLQSQGPYNHAATPVTLTALTAPMVLTDSSAGILTIKMPAAPITNQAFWLVDQTASWATHTVTFDPNGKNLDGSASTVSLTTASGTLGVWYDGTEWHTILKR